MQHGHFPFWIAHRGAGKLAPENTLAAFCRGAAHGYRAFECDVKLSADLQPFLLHDATLERTTNGRGTAGALDWAELSQLDAGGWHSPAFAGEPLASLAAIAAYVQRNGFALNVEIKPTPGLETATGSAVATACARLWADSDAPLLLSSFETDALRAANASAPHLARALLLDTLWPHWQAAANELGCVAVVTHHRLMNAALMAELRAAGLRAICYTVNESHEAQRLQSLGVHGVITDAVDRFVPSQGEGA